ncbi:MAG: class II glutamine amidotransferase [Candidatus Delongbacteria bacterium]|nr:class II glutamine amidotransferase [bacterium]MBL7033690.1 class II glutamine amidotransferase [Candidatus Delongbacteria bacterium]
MYLRLLMLTLCLLPFATGGACTLWGFNPVEGYTIGGNPTLIANAVAQMANLQRQGGWGSNWPWNHYSGWGAAFYGTENSAELPPEQLWRGVEPAYASSAFDSVEIVIAQDSERQVQLALAHVRAASSGATGIPDPHPFVARRPGADLTFMHNGTLSKTELRELLGEEWLQEHPPQTWSDSAWTTPEGWARVVDSELFFFWLLKNIDEQGGDLTAGIQQALFLIRQLSGDRNFLLSDGADVYAYRGGGPAGSASTPPSLWYQTGLDDLDNPLYHAVTTLPADTSQGGWIALESDLLVVLPNAGPVQLIGNISGEPATEEPVSLLTLSNYPNPFNIFTTIGWDNPETGNLRIVIHDLLGRRVKELYHGPAGQGSGSCRWYGDTANGSPAASGLYVASATIAGRTTHHRLLLVR